VQDVITGRGTSASRHGSIHWREWKTTAVAREGVSRPILALLHPLPHAGSFFERIAPLLVARRRVIAPDYPGFGCSDALDSTPTIGLYAEAMIDVLRELSSAPADLFGFHTGCLVGVEMALQFPAEVRRLVQVDVPFFTPEERCDLLSQDRATGGFAAVFSYASQMRYPGLGHECLVLATHSSLLQPSRAAARAIPCCRLREFPEISAPALENGTETIAAAALDFLDS
jgi:pimeloyl-ACP methyl ester carboxylesterase